MELESLLNSIKEKDIKNLSSLIDLNITSESTLRRKLKKLDSLGYIKFNRGGEIELIEQRDISIKDEFKMDINKFEKRQVARRAVSFIEDNDVIFIDNGTTIRYMFYYLQKKNVIVYTNGYSHIDYRGDVDLRIIPGQVRIKEKAIVGEEALIFLSKLKIDKTFIGANGISENGVTTPNEDEKNLKQLALEIATDSFIVLDSSKDGLTSKFKICEYDDYQIVSDKIKKK